MFIVHIVWSTTTESRGGCGNWSGHLGQSGGDDVQCHCTGTNFAQNKRNNNKLIHMLLLVNSLGLSTENAGY